MPTRKLPVKLNDEELADRGRAVAKAVEDRAALQEEKKAADADINGKIKSQGEIIRCLSRVITTGTEDREVEVAINKDNESRMISVVREDTGEIVESRPMTADELQQNLFPPRAAKKFKGKLAEEGESGGPAE
jgi:protein subunit release factor A